MTTEQWGQVKQKLRQALGANNYEHWIEPLEMDSVSNGVLTLMAPSAYAGTYVKRNFGDTILGEIANLGSDVRRVEFTSAPAQANRGAAPRSDAPATPAPRPKAPATTTSKQDKMLQPAPLDPGFTFDSFVVGKPNALAHAAARRVAEGDQVEFNPLFLYGGVGLGKTHLMHAIAWKLKELNPDLNVVYLSAEHFMYRFVQALRDRNMMDFKSLFRNVDVLMVDDVQFIAGKDSTQEEFFHTFNTLVENGKQIIISADSAPAAIANMEERISSRLSSGLVVDLHPTDYELRLGILQSKLESYREKYPDLQVADGIMEFLAARISTNVRVLEGALTRLFAFGMLVEREITMELTQDCLADVLRASERKITIEEIQRRVAEHFNIRISDMIGPKRVRSFARPRQVAMFLCKKLTSRSLPEIGKRFGGRDHTTIIHGVRRIEELIQKDSQLADDLEMLRRTLEA
ncbi:chromosomal replication initiator protein DnaA [Pseudooceanicola aestuarii]|uniref:chromosomal replication initiator protein DnaA n=1 Tax=Pseudooceanicola aestuarii TaxID=2697319 RepID=UPI0013D86CF1|nr:chromosomal replication initiator protein DnaA [Pseudooceanicola aestuarii]